MTPDEIMNDPKMEQSQYGVMVLAAEVAKLREVAEKLLHEIVHRPIYWPKEDSKEK